MTITSSTCGVWTLDDSHKKISAGRWATFAGLDTFTAGELWSWGYGNGGRLGDNTTLPKSSPVLVPGTQWILVSVNGNSNISSLKSDGTLWSWGYNTCGGLGLNNNITRSSPTQVPGEWGWLSGGHDNVGAVKSDNTLWTWGRNNYGFLGIGDTINRSSPTQVPGNQWCTVSMGLFKHAAAIKTDGTLWAWGCNYDGQLGQQNNISRSSPVQVPGTNWVEVCSGGTHTLARKTDGTLWAWGYNVHGQVGVPFGIVGFRVSSPVQVPGTQWTSINAGQGESYATKSDGTLWSWGCGGPNTATQLGRGDTGAACRCLSSPNQIPGTQWVCAKGGNFAKMAFKSDGTMWVWGLGGNYGALNNSQRNQIQASPVQLGGTWNTGCIANSNGFGIRRI